MDATHLHLILTHFPIVGTIIGIVILAYGQFKKNDDIKKVALVTFMMMAFLTIPVFLTGGEAEENVENIAGISERLIEKHEELAEKAIWLMGLLGVLSLINFFAIARKWSFAKTISLITLIVSLGTFSLFAKVGNTGGEIRHSEIRANNVNNENGLIESSENKEHDDSDDD
jgi:uncharacterized membrane protein